MSRKPQKNRSQATKIRPAITSTVSSIAPGSPVRFGLVRRRSGGGRPCPPRPVRVPGVATVGEGRSTATRSKHALGLLPIAPAVAPHERVGRDPPFGQPDPHDLRSGRTELSARWPAGRTRSPPRPADRRARRRPSDGPAQVHPICCPRHPDGPFWRIGPIALSAPWCSAGICWFRRARSTLFVARPAAGTRLLSRRCSRELGRVLSKGILHLGPADRTNALLSRLKRLDVQLMPVRTIKTYTHARQLYLAKTMPSTRGPSAEVAACVHEPIRL